MPPVPSILRPRQRKIVDGVSYFAIGTLFILIYPHIQQGRWLMVALNIGLIEMNIRALRARWDAYARYWQSREKLRKTIQGIFNEHE